MKKLLRGEVMALEALAEQITDYLFTNGAGHKAKRLVLEMPDGLTGGGWGREPLRDAILAKLETALENAPDRLE